MNDDCTATEASYIRGCRCDDCKAARSSAVKRRKAAKHIADKAAAPKPEGRRPTFTDETDTFTRGQLYAARGWD